MRLYRVILLSSIGLFACEKTELPSDDQNFHALFLEGQILAQLEDLRIDEASGIAESIRYPGHFWIHNDSGDEARLFLVDSRGQTVATLSLKGISHRDWEDIATGSGPDKNDPYIYIGEIGDNDAQYLYKNIYRLKEPKLDNLDKDQNLTSEVIETITFTYQDGNRDAETLMLDPKTNDLYIISKREDQVRLYTLKYPQSLSDTLDLPVMHTMPFKGITAGDISADGSEILIKSLTQVYYWNLKNTETVLDALNRQAKRLPYFVEPQGEAIAWLKDGSGYVTLSEKSKANIIPKLYIYSRRK